MRELTWTREGKRHGPADTLNGRYVVSGYQGHWRVWDRVERYYTHGYHFTMKDAKVWLEQAVRQGDLPHE